MQEFFINYGLYLLIALLVVIAVVFLLSSGKKAAPDQQEVPVEARPEPALAPEIMAAPVIVPEAMAVVPVEPVAVPASSDGDDLMKMKGVGAKLNSLLIELGVTRYAQIAAWSEADIATIDAKLGAFKGRPVRDQWVDQARFLAAGDIAGYEARYGKI